MATKILINYTHHSDDEKYLKNFANIEILTSNYAAEGIDDFIEKAEVADLIIVKDHGLSICNLLNAYSSNQKLLDIFASKTKRKVFWSEDSHHLWQYEVPLQKHFDHIYVAHSDFLHHFDPQKVSWLPCCFHWFSIDKTLLTIEENERNRNKKPGLNTDLLYYYKNYKIGNRNQVALKIKQFCDNMGIQSVFGFLGNLDNTLTLIRNSNTLLNISLLSELNQRNFQAMVFNKVLLTDETSDHSKIDLPWDNTFLFKRDLSNFSEKLQEALTHKPTINTTSQIINGHMLIHRWLKIFNNELGLNVKIDEIKNITP